MDSEENQIIDMLCQSMDKLVLYDISSSKGDVPKESGTKSGNYFAVPNLPETGQHSVGENVVPEESGARSREYFAASILPEIDQHSVGENDVPKQSSESSREYFAVSIFPETDRHSVAIPPIYVDMLQTMRVIKQYRQSRFKKFVRFKDALQFVWLPFKESSSENIASPAPAEEQQVSFPSVTSQQLVHLRKQIKAGNEAAFLKLVWSNPRYLINHVDGPTILQEGMRHNALHIASVSHQKNLCIAILNTLTDLKFLALLYPGEDSSMLKNRRRHTLDMYLNTPDKPSNERPLHLASKFGASEIVKILLSYADCESNIRNKSNLLPEQIVYSRSPVQSDALKNKMQAMFDDDKFYVPILRDINNTLEPVVGEPCEGDFILQSLLNSAQLDKLVCCAFAGPMKLVEATSFYFALRKLDFSKLENFSCGKLEGVEKKELRKIILSDPIKGLEQIGRKLSQVFSTPWMEFWIPLDAWADISSQYGLILLENHLQFQNQMKKSISQMSNSTCAALKMDEKVNALLCLLQKGLVNNFVKLAEDVIVKKVSFSWCDENLFQLFKVLLPYTTCMTDFTFSIIENLRNIHYEIGYLIYLRIYSAMDYENLQKFIFLLNTGDSPVFKSRKLKFLMCIIDYVCFHHITTLCAGTNRPVCTCEWMQPTQDNPCYYSSSAVYSELFACRSNFLHEIHVGDEYFGLAPSPPPSDESSSDTQPDKFYTPPESPTDFSVTGDEIYINGENFAESDIDIYRSLENIQVNECTHPLVYNWKFHVESKLRVVMKKESVLSRTPASSSAAIKRHLICIREEIEKEKESKNNKIEGRKIVPRTLF